ncbi:MAG: pimeloyl-ACP methyl ester carboxylesterase [Mariniblastus sp.]|jgi:pimeloyl-ACP methyl ester carboxylesterase
MSSITLENASHQDGSPSSDSVARTDASWRAEYAFAPNYLELEGHRIQYVDEGPQDGNQDPVLMVHGNPTWSFYWRRLIAKLSPERRTVAIDHLGCGLSDKPADYDYCLQNHIDNLCRLIDELDLKNITLMAHDWGGAIGMGALLARKDRFKKIVLFNTATFPPPFIPFRIRVCRWPLIGKLGVQGMNMFARAATFMATERKGGLPKPIADGLLAPYDNWANRVAIYSFVKDIPLSKNHKTWDVLEKIEAGLASVSDWPILMMWGMKDWCFRPECLHRLQGHWPNAEVHEIADAGHYVIEDAADQVGETVVDFLGRHQS